MHEVSQAHIADLLDAYPALEGNKVSIELASELLIRCFDRGGRLYICGNGGSAADCAHITGELVKGYRLKRPLPKAMADALAASDPVLGQEMACRLQGGLGAIDLTAQSAVITATANDLGADYIYAQQLMAYGRPGDALICISTSGTARNVNCALAAAKALGMVTIVFSGRGGQPAVDMADVAIRVPADMTYQIQEYHLPVYHAVCAAVEAHFFK